MEAPDQKLRRWLLALLLFGGVLFYLAGRVARDRWAFDAANQETMPYGGSGLGLARIAPRAPGKLRVVLLGNSAYQMRPVAHELHERAAHDPHGIEMVNLAQAGAGIADNLVQCAFAMSEDAKPDLVVLTVGSFSFGNLGFQFNTDCASVPFQQGISQWLTTDFYRRQYDLHAAVDAAIGAVLPLKQMDPIVRHHWTQSWPGLLQRRLSLPRLNRMAAEFDEFYRRGSYHEGAAWLDRPLRADYAVACDELLGMLDRQGIPVLVIREPCKHFAMSDLVTPYLNSLESRWPGLRFVDLESEWRKDDFMDPIHPLQTYAPAYAERHYKLMMEELEKRYPVGPAGKRS